MNYPTRRPAWRVGLTAFSIFLIYAISAKLGLTLAYINASATAIWAPTGIALAAFLIFGEQYWPSVFVGAFLVNYMTNGSLLTSAFISGGNTLEGLLGALLVRQFCNGSRVFEKAADILKFAIFAETLSTTVSATVGVTTLCLNRQADWPLYKDIWVTWWLGDLTGALIVTPFLLLWFENPRIQLRQFPLRLASLALVLFTGQAVFGNWFFSVAQNIPLEFLCVPPLIWIAYRFGLRETATASLLLAGIGLWNTLHGNGPFAHSSINQALLQLQVFMGVVSITALALASAIAEKDTAEQNLERAQKAEEKLREKIELIQLLRSITAAANESRDLTEAIQLSLVLICRYTGWPVGHVYYVDSAGGHQLRPGAQWCLRDDKKYANFRHVTEQRILQPGEGLPGMVYVIGEPQWYEDIEHHSNFPRARMGVDIKVRSGFAFPITTEKTIVAVLEFFSDHTAPPDTDLMESMKQVGVQLGRVVERQRSEQAQSQLALLVETSSDFIVTTNPEGFILYLNDAGRAMVGLERDFNVNLLKHEDFVFEKDIPKLKGEVLTALMSKGHWEGEFHLKNFKTGAAVPIYFSAGILRDSKTGNPSTLAAIGHDVTDIKKAEEALYNSQKHSQALIENSLDIVTVLDQEGHYTFLSPSMLNVLGYAPEELIGTNAFELIHPDDLPAVLEKFEKVLKNADEIESVPFRFKLKDGSWKPLEAIGRNLLADPSVKGVVVNSRDMTEQKRAQAEIQKTNSFLSAILENIPNMVFVKDAENLKFVLFNKAGEDLIGVPRQELIGKSDYDFFTKEQADFFTANDRKVLAGKKMVNIAEETIKTQDKGDRLLHTKKLPVLNDDGSLRFLLGISEDITEAKKTKLSLKESEEKFKLLVENVHDHAIFLLDPEGHVMTWNEGAERIKGYKASEIIGRHFSCFYPPELAKTGYPDKLLRTAALEGHVNETGWRIRKDGSQFWADVVISPLYDESGGLRGFTKVTRDISEQHASEQELEKQTALLQSIIDNMGEGLLVCDEKGKTLFANPAADQMLGGQIGDPTPQGQMKNQVFWGDGQTIIAPEDFPISRSLLGESSDNVELFIKNKNKPEGIYILATSRPLRSAEGKVTGAVSVFRDITDQKQNEAERQRLVSLVEHSRDMIVWSNPEGKNLYINDAGRKMLGLDPEMDVQFIKLESLMPPEQMNNVLAIRKDQQVALREKGFWEGEVSIQNHITREPVPLHLSIVALKEPKSSKVLGTATIGRDMTERRKAEKIARESDMRFRAVVQSSPNAILVADSQGKILSWNQGAEQVFGYKESDIVGQPFTLIMPEKFREAHEEDIKIIRTNGSTRFIGRTVELMGLRKNGSEFPIELTLSTWKVEEDIFFGGIIRDITERKKMEELLRSNTELQQFANVASHDLQEPLRMVASYVQLLSQHFEGKLDEDAKEYMKYAVEGAKRMQLLVNGLLEYSRVESRGKPPQLTDMNEIFAQTLSNIELRIAETGAKITRGTLPQVMGDPVQLSQLLQNLFSNALKFQKNIVPTIEVTAEEKNDEWVFCCKDNGIGIDPKYFDRIFVIFQRLHHRDEYSGTGIGLAICKRIVERHGGRIWVESKPGTGSAFFFHTTQKERMTMVETEKNTLRVLLVEDTPGDVRLITEGFKRTGLNVQMRVAEDGEEALNVLFSEDAIDPPFYPDLVLLDLNLPLVSGHEVLHLIKSNKKLAHIPVIILTSSLLDEDMKKAHDHSADLYVIKPINLIDYFEAVRQIGKFWEDRKK